jgi:molybdenum cofactor biosynthesis enzyme MoaA
MSPKDFMDAVSFFRQHGLTSISISGGEPLLYPFLERLLRHLNLLGLSVSVTTNGTVEVGSFLDLAQELGVRLKVGMYGPPHIHNKLQPNAPYSQVLATVTRALVAQLPLTINTMICRQNSDPGCVNTFIWKLVKIGVRRVRFIRYARRRHDVAHGEYHLTNGEFDQFRHWVTNATAEWKGAIEIRWSDYFSHPYIVLEPSGFLMLEHGDCEKDVCLHNFAPGRA